MTTERSTPTWLPVRAAAVVALLLSIPAATFAQDKASPKYSKRVIKSNFMKFPTNAIAVGMVGANKGKLIGACGMFNMIKIMDPDSGEIVRSYGLPDYPVDGCDGKNQISVKRVARKLSVYDHHDHVWKYNT